MVINHRNINKKNSVNQKQHYDTENILNIQNENNTEEFKRKIQKYDMI